ncbi:CoA transferase [Agrobacterium rubi]|uniref:CaiB/BaiF CoA transferase family protein n=1 Tax=Agrobacterium rubi TaxID=28099 RepID=UPI001571C506|nr:CaiB/BaiF CoA-transferase family protein [Agrobacterium rubi]NTF10573.1 CoA transferase [Agrobacterium rubi]NTF22967.1 CoA transferase [Agrobacterium rubi]NTF29898.1 CoA transferase [Agrobacterium rubi]
MEKKTRLPLDGVRVIAIEQAVAAPFCSSRLADAGAEVVKIERPEGDFARGYDDVCAGQSSYFVWLNRGKQSLVVDLATELGKKTLVDLLSEADILIQNLKPGALDRLGFSPQKLRQTHPRLISCSISGYGEAGPLADRKAYDLLIQAESGLSSVTGGPDAPARVGISIVDIATGATAYSAILEALLTRAATGKGADIRISMFDVMADWLTVPLLHQEGGKPPKRIGMAHPSIAPYGIFQTKDNKDVLISIQSDREWAKFCAEFLRQPEKAQDPQFAKNVTRVANREATDKLVATAFGDLAEADAKQLLTKSDVAFASVNDMAALSAHPHLRRITVETQAGPVSYPAPAPIFVDSPRSYGSVPALGENAFAAREASTDTQGAT